MLSQVEIIYLENKMRDSGLGGVYVVCHYCLNTLKWNLKEAKKELVQLKGGSKNDEMIGLGKMPVSGIKEYERLIKELKRIPVSMLYDIFGEVPICNSGHTDRLECNRLRKIGYVEIPEECI